MAIVLMLHLYTLIRYDMEVLTVFGALSFASSVFMVAYVSMNNRKALKKLDETGD